VAPHNERTIRRGPDRGCVVTYLDKGAGDRPSSLRLGIVVGPVAADPDPESTEVWIGVRIPRANATTTVDLITTSSIVQIEKPGEPDQSS
jgi:hypothetical protein